MHILNLTTLMVLITMHCAFVSSHPSPTDLRNNEPIAMELHLHPAGNDSLTPEEALQGNHLAARNDNMAIMMLPIPSECKTVLKNAIPASKAAFEWIKKTVCEKYKCKVAFAPTYRKYSIDPIKKHIIMDWIFGTMERNKHPIQKSGIHPDEVFDRIVKKCIEGDSKIMGIEDVCSASQDSFKDIKSCVIGEVVEYVPQVTLWAGKACKIALQKNLVEKIGKPVFKPNWRKLVSDFKTNKLCRK